MQFLSKIIQNRIFSSLSQLEFESFGSLLNSDGSVVKHISVHFQNQNFKPLMMLYVSFNF